MYQECKIKTTPLFLKSFSTFPLFFFDTILKNGNSNNVHYPLDFQKLQ